MFEDANDFRRFKFAEPIVFLETIQEKMMFSVSYLIETGFSCSGFCEPGLFPIAKSVTKQRIGDDQGCFEQATDFLGDKTGFLFIFCMISGIMAVVNFILHFGLYCTDSKDASRENINYRDGDAEASDNYDNVPQDSAQKKSPVPAEVVLDDDARAPESDRDKEDPGPGIELQQTDANARKDIQFDIDIE